MDIQSMSIEEKVGQLFIVGFDGYKVNGEIINLISTYKIGGFCYVNNNFKNTKQVHKLSSVLQHYADKNLPLFLAIHQQGGSSNTLANGVTRSPSQRQIGHINNRLYTKQMAEIVGNELRAMGINLNFAPYLDVDEKDEKSFGANIELVSKHGLAAIQGYQKTDVIAAAKIDAYLNEAMKNNFFDSITLQPLLMRLENELETIVISNQIFTSLLEDIPATSSYKVNLILLRDKLAYDGIIIADCLDELASNSKDHAISAILAGVDVLLTNDTYENQLKTIDGIIQAVAEGKISEERINQSVERVLALKAKRNIGTMETFNSENFKRNRSVAFAEKLTTFV